MYKQYIDIEQKKFWEESWKNFTVKELMTGLENTDLWKILKKYLPKNGRILEGGCGLGHWVKFLSDKGYDIIGIDYVEDVIKQAKNEFNDLKIFVGNVLKTDFPDNYFDSYISLGVIEHFENDAVLLLNEAKRILKQVENY
ncbi:MAG: class I SAM-dependent methyltransferase [Elusimicrobiota bacterium]|nr:class I SAM-dependent methyltransferase [Endomicrobiia bacterium]MDW8166023.1 class I SAM-dependent methyltransferase [Elusimicrobiota bacterium]